jgi:hypothetical protein
MRPNFLPSLNPWGLATPPDWFLDELCAQDGDAVIFPSEEAGLYRLARRVKHGRAMMSFLHHPDARICRDHGLIPFTSVLPESLGMSWGRVLLNLAETDTQRVGGPSKVGALLDEHDAAREAAMARTQRQELLGRGESAWNLAQLWAGSRISLADHRPLSGPPKGESPVHAPGGAGACWVGR